jgi:hypothetical protein
MSDPSDDPPPRAERTYDTTGDSAFDSAEADRRDRSETDRRQRTVLLVVLLVCMLPVAGCGFLFAVCALFKF